MFINITDKDTADNKASSGNLVHYLDKENRTNIEAAPEYWFNGKQIDIPSDETRLAIDRNIAKLSKTDAKFFLINISPSQKEIAHLKQKFGEDGAKEQLKAYAAAIMDEYALNFKRPGIQSNADLLWFGKLENYRYYSHKDPEVKQGIRKRGERKQGEQMHIQVIVSRKDITNKIKLSPMNKSRGKNTEHSKKMGQFDRSAFKASGEKVFDERFDFDRGLTETFRYANAQKNGSLEQRLALHAEKADNNSVTVKAQEQRPVVTHEYQQEKDTGSNFLKLALTKPGADVAPTVPKKKKRKRTKGQQPDQGLNL